MKFIASRLSKGNKMFPAEIITEDNGIKVKIPGFLSGNTQFISYEKISAVEVDSPMIGFSTLTFFHDGNKVEVHGFSKSDAETIQVEIEKGKKNNK
jgi:hypothetical protein